MRTDQSLHYWQVCNTSNILRLRVGYVQVGTRLSPERILTRNLRTFDYIKVRHGVGIILDHFYTVGFGFTSLHYLA